MASNDAAKVMPGGDAKVCDTIEIKIRTLDSQDHVLRVKEWIPIPVLKKKIASVTGVSPEDQHLIFDGRIFEDDQCLSTYHVEDGHTLHLLARQSHQSAAASTNQIESNAYGHPGTSSASGSGQTRGSQVAYGSALESGQNRSSQGVHASNQLSQANISSERSRQVNNDTTRGTRSQDAARVFNVVPQLVESHRRFVREDLNGSSCSQQRLSPPEPQEPQRTMLSQRTQAGSGTIRATEPNDAARGSNVLPQQVVLMRQTNNVRQIERLDLNVSHRQLGQPAAQSSKCTKAASNQLSQANISSERSCHVNNDTTRGTRSQDAARVFNVVPQLVEFHRRFVREDLNGSSCSQQRLSPPEPQEPQRTMLSQRTQAGSGTIRATKPNDATRGSNVLPQQVVLMRQTNNVRQIERGDLNVSHRQLGQPAAQSSKCTKNLSNNDCDQRTQANDDATGVVQSHDTTSVGSNGVFSTNASHPLVSLTSQDGEHQISWATPNYSTVQIQRELLNDSSSSQHQRDPFKAPSKKRTKRNND